MSLPVDIEDEYLDDLIQLIPSDAITHTPEPEGLSSYRRKSYVPVTFFNNERNIKLLNSCRPLSIQLIDCKLNYVTNKSDSIDSDVNDIVKKSEALTLSMEDILGRISSNGLSIKRKTNLHKSKTGKKIKGVDYKKNKGLIGMKVSQTFEILEIDSESESEESQSSNEKADNMSKELDCKNNKDVEMDTVFCMKLVNETLETSRDITALSKNDLNCHSNYKSEEKTLVLSTKADNKQTNETSTLSMVNNNVNDQSQMISDLMDTYEDAKRNRDNRDGRINECENENVKRDNQERNIMENTQNRKGENNDDELSKIAKEAFTQIEQGIETVENTQKVTRDDEVRNDTEIEECKKTETIISNGSSSPVFPCTPQIKNRKFYKEPHNILTLEINQPRDFENKKIKSNTMNSPKNNNQQSPEKVNDIQRGVTRHPNEKLNSNNLESTKTNICEEGRQKKTDNTVPSPPNMTCELASVNIGTVAKNYLLTQPHSECVKNVSTTAAVLQSETKRSNKEKIIRLKLDENVYKKVIEKQKINKNNTHNNTYTVDVDNIASKLPTQAVSSANFKDWKQQPFQSVDTIRPQNNTVNTQNLGSKRVHVFQKIGSAIIRRDPNAVDKRHQILTKNRIRPFTGSISSWQNMVNKPNNDMQKNELSKNVDLVKPISHRVPGPQLQNKVLISETELTSSPQTTGKVFENKVTNAPNQTANSECKDTLACEATSFVGNELNNISENSVVYENVSKSMSQNVTNITECNKSNPSQNFIYAHPRQNCCVSSFEPQPRQFVRSMKRNHGTHALSLRNHPKHMYPNNTINRNYVQMYQEGYTNNYNPYWPYLYTRLPPPPPPPPPPVENSRGNSNISHLKDKKTVNVIKQINIISRPASEKLHYNTSNTSKPNIVDIDINTISPPKYPNDNKSPSVVSSKSEMFEELEKEMMNIHHEDLENFINKELRDCNSAENNTKPCSNVTNHALMKPGTEKINIISQFQSEDNGEKNTKAIKRPSSIIVSKDNAKKKKNDIAKTKKQDKLVENTNNSSHGYSPPILPIPCFKKSLETLKHAGYDVQQRTEDKEKSEKSMDEDITRDNVKDKIKKISLDDYKKRGKKKQIGERKKRKYERKKESKSSKKCLDTKNSDQDQGYDSDTTVIL